MDQLFFKVYVFLLNVAEFSGIFYEVLIDGTRIFPLNLLIVLLVVLEILNLQGLHDTLKVPLLAIYNLFFGQALGRDVTIVKVYTNMLVPHLKITSDSRISDDLLILLVFLFRLIDLIAIEHGVRGDVAQCGL